MDKAMQPKEKVVNYDLFGEPIIEKNNLKDDFLFPPFSILDTQSGDWQNRKKLWQQLGIQSEIGRHAECMGTFGGELDENG